MNGNGRPDGSGLWTEVNLSYGYQGTCRVRDRDTETRVRSETDLIRRSGIVGPSEDE